MEIYLIHLYMAALEALYYYNLLRTKYRLQKNQLRQEKRRRQKFSKTDERAPGMLL